MKIIAIVESDDYGPAAIIDPDHIKKGVNCLSMSSDTTVMENEKE